MGPTKVLADTRLTVRIFDQFLDVAYWKLNDTWLYKWGKCGCFVLIKMINGQSGSHEKFFLGKVRIYCIFCLVKIQQQCQQIIKGRGQRARLLL